jgi:hypothetical protein
MLNRYEINRSSNSNSNDAFITNLHDQEENSITNTLNNITPQSRLGDRLINNFVGPNRPIMSGVGNNDVNEIDEFELSMTSSVRDIRDQNPIGNAI